MTSSRLYSLVTKYWPRIAAGLVIALGVIELVVGGLTADSGVEFYLMAWAGTTGGLWFLFEKAEKSLGEDARRRVTTWLASGERVELVESLPTEFAAVFDGIFGERHWTRRCFNRSCAASLASFLLVLVSALALSSFGQVDPRLFLAALGPVVLLNFVPDYLSLLETRWAIRVMERTGRLASVLAFDVLATAIVSIVGMLLVPLAVIGPLQLVVSAFVELPMDWSGVFIFPALILEALVGVTPMEMGIDVVRQAPVLTPDVFLLMVRVSFLSAFFTSVRLWLYAASVLLSRILLRMNSGVGFLLSS